MINYFLLKGAVRFPGVPRHMVVPSDGYIIVSHGKGLFNQIDFPHLLSIEYHIRCVE